MHSFKFLLKTLTSKHVHSYEPRTVIFLSNIFTTNDLYRRRNDVLIIQTLFGFADTIMIQTLFSRDIEPITYLEI